MTAHITEAMSAICTSYYLKAWPTVTIKHSPCKHACTKSKSLIAEKTNK